MAENRAVPTFARRLRRAVTGLSLLLFSTTACSPLSMLDAMVPTSGYVAETGIAYGETARQRLDVYKPTGIAVADDLVVVWLYGGGWTNGSREDYRFVGQTLASRGYTTVVPDYGLFPEVRFPAFNQDAAAAVAWARENLTSPDGTAPRIVLAGHSAGAHIAALVALDRRYVAAEGVPEDAIAGVIAIAGPLSFDLRTFRSTSAIFEHSTPEEFAPINFARADAPPVLVIHGTTDTTVAPWNSQRFADRMRSVGGLVRHVPVEGVGHYLIVASLAQPFADENDPVLSATLEFLNQVAR